MGQPPPLAGVKLRPEVVLPGGRVRVFVSKLALGSKARSAVARLQNVNGQRIAEVQLTASDGGFHGILLVSPKASEGSYDVVATSKGRGEFVASLLVLSRTTLARLRTAFKAERQRERAYEQVAQHQLDQALKYLSAAEALYQKAKWDHLEAETILERSHVLMKAGRESEHYNALRAAMLKFNLAGLVSRNSGAYGKAALYFEKAKDLAVSLEDSKQILLNQGNLGEVLLYLRSFPQAQKNLLAALQRAIELEDKANEARVHKNLAAAYLLQHRFQEALQELAQAATLFEVTGEQQSAYEVSTFYRRLKATVTEGVSPPIFIEPLLRRPAVTQGVNVHRVIGQVIRKTKPMAERQEVALTARFPKRHVRIVVDPQQFEMVLERLLTNAIAATPKGGTVRVMGYTESLGERTGVSLVVSDTGPGIPAEVVSKVFDPLFTTKPRAEGVGLGLYLCAEIIGNHGGTIQLETPKGHGTAVKVWLPVTHEKHA